LLFRHLPLLEKIHHPPWWTISAPTTHYSPFWDRRPLVVSAKHPPDASSVAIGELGTAKAAKMLPDDDDDGVQLEVVVNRPK
jgi:hypothetical protein